MDYIRASREPRHALVISDPQPVGSVRAIWGLGRPGGQYIEKNLVGYLAVITTTDDKLPGQSPHAGSV